MARTCSGSEHATSRLVLEAAGVRLLSDAAEGRAWHQVSSDDEGPCRFRFRDGERQRKRNVVSLVHEVVLRQAMADRGWRVPQFVLQEGWASVVTEAGNLATWLVDGVAGRRGVSVAAAGDAGA